MAGCATKRAARGEQPPASNHPEAQGMASINPSTPTPSKAAPLPTLDQLHVNLANAKLLAAARILETATMLISEAYCVAPEPLSLKIADILTAHAQTEQMLKESIT
jgi:hypothetical protein